MESRSTPLPRRRQNDYPNAFSPHQLPSSARSLSSRSALRAAPARGTAGLGACAPRCGPAWPSCCRGGNRGSAPGPRWGASPGRGGRTLGRFLDSSVSTGSQPHALQTPCFNTCHPDILNKCTAIEIQNPMSTKPPLRDARASSRPAQEMRPTADRELQPFCLLCTALRKAASVRPSRPAIGKHSLSTLCMSTTNVYHTCCCCSFSLFYTNNNTQIFVCLAARRVSTCEPSAQMAASQRSRGGSDKGSRLEDVDGRFCRTKILHALGLDSVRIFLSRSEIPQRTGNSPGSSTRWIPVCKMLARRMAVLNLRMHAATKEMGRSIVDSRVTWMPPRTSETRRDVTTRALSHVRGPPNGKRVLKRICKSKLPYGLKSWPGSIGGPWDVVMPLSGARKKK